MTDLKLTSVGFDIPEATFLQTTVELASGMDIGQWIYLENEAADVILVNTDRLSCQSAIAQYAAAGHQKEGLFISCSEDCTQASATTLSLRRPITYPALVSLLAELQVELRKMSNTSSPELVKQNEKKSVSVKVQQPSPVPRAPRPAINERRLAELPTEEFELPEEPTIMEDISLDVEFSDIDDNSMDISKLFEAAELSVLYDLIEPADSAPKKVEPAHSPGKQTESETKQAPIHSIEHLDTDSQKPAEGNERDLLLLDRPARRFYEATRFLGLIKGIIDRGQATEITHFQFPAVRIFPDQKTYAAPQDNGLSAKMFRTLVVEFSTRKLSKADERETPSGWQVRPLWELLFLATLYGSEGRLMETAQLQDKLQLISEPDYDIVPREAEYETIANAMPADQAADLKTIADQSGVMIETVIDFCNACEEVQLINRISSGESDATTNDKPAHRLELNISAIGEPEDAGNTNHKSLVKRIKSIFKNNRP